MQIVGKRQSDPLVPIVVLHQCLLLKRRCLSEEDLVSASIAMLIIAHCLELQMFFAAFSVVPVLPKELSDGIV